MELRPDEQTLLADFRSLPPEGRREVQDLAAFLVEKYRNDLQETGREPSNQCTMGKPREPHPEADPEPIFTE